MFKCQCLCLFGFLLNLQGFTTINNITLVVKNIPTFPFPIGKTFDIIISAKEEDGLLTDSVLDTLVIQIRKPFGTGQQIAIMDFGLKDKNDNKLIGEFMKVLSWSISEDNKLSVALVFSSLAHNKVLEIYHLNVFSTAERRIKLKDLKLATNIYRSNITLHAPPMIEIMVNSAVDGPFAFAMGSTVNAVCRANGTSNANPRFHKIINMKAIRNSRTEKEAQLQFVATKAAHHKNLTCQVGNENKSVNIQVFHGPTKVTFKPEVTGVVRNGTGITCVAADGFPTPRITWHFIEGPMNASQFYTISHYNQRLFLSGKAPIGSRWKFNCSSINDVLGTEQVYHKDLSFTVTDQMRSNSKANFTRKQGNMSDNCENYLIDEIKRTIRNNSENLMKTLDSKYDKIQNEISKWSPELSKVQKYMELLKDQNKDQNIEIGKLRKNMELLKDQNKEKRKMRKDRDQVTASMALEEPDEAYQWQLDDFNIVRWKGESIYSPIILGAKFNVTFWFVTKIRHVVVIRVFMSPISIPLTPPAIAKLTIYNAENLNFYQSDELTLPITKNFVFEYQKLLEAKVLQSNKIIIGLICTFPPK